MRVIVDVQHDALLVPQRAVSEFQGGYQVAVVDTDNKVAIRTVTVGAQVDNRWMISDGLNPGERVIAEGPRKFVPACR